MHVRRKPVLRAGSKLTRARGRSIANYWLSHVDSPEIGQADRDSDLQIHDLDRLAGYCADRSLRTLLREGFNGVPGKVGAAARRHMS